MVLFVCTGCGLAAKNREAFNVHVAVECTDKLYANKSRLYNAADSELVKDGVLQLSDVNRGSNKPDRIGQGQPPVTAYII